MSLPESLGEAEGLAAIVSSLVLDLGQAATGGRRPGRGSVFVAGLGAAGGGGAIWHWFPWLFDHHPGWAVLAAGGWAILAIVALALFGARVGATARGP
jgi:hypothetical protein